MANDQDGLTEAQANIMRLLISTWQSLSSPTIVVLDAPSGRGKTRIVQNFYDDLVAMQPEGRKFWQGSLAQDGLRDWRKNRKNVSIAQRPNATQMPDWIWFGLDGYPAGKANLLEEIQELNSAIFEAYEEEKLPDDRRSSMRRGPTRGVPWEIAKAAIDIIANFVPVASFVKTGVETTASIGRAVAARDELGIPLAISDPAFVAQAVLITSFTISLLGDLDRALAPVILAIDDAHLLEPNAVASIDAMLRANPDDELLGSGLLRGQQHDFAAIRGVPPVAPIMVLATRQPSHDARPDYFGARLEVWKSLGLDVVTIADSGLPLISKDEAIGIVSNRLANNHLDETQLDLIASRAYDHLLEGVNASLLISHCERVWRLSNPASTLTATWAEEHLPRYLEQDARERYDELQEQGQRAVLAGSLRGTVFAQSSVSILLPELSTTDAWVAEVDQSGYAQLYDVLDGDHQFSFSDEPAFSFAQKLAFEDDSMCMRAVSKISGPLMQDFFTFATVESNGSGMAFYDFARQEAYTIAELVRNANLNPEDMNEEVWAAVLGYGAEREYTLEEAQGETRMRDLWASLASSSALLEGDGWAIAARWVIHKYMPGVMTFGSVRTMPPMSGPKLTRFHSEAPGIAAKVAGRVLPYLLADGRQLLEPGLRLLFRLGMAGKLLPGRMRKLVAANLLLVSPARLSAGVLLARVYNRDLTKDQRAELYDVFSHNHLPDIGDWHTREALGLLWLGHPVSSEQQAQTINQLAEVMDSQSTLFEDGGFGVMGNMYDVSDPLIYPYSNTKIYAAASLLSSPMHITVPSTVEKLAVNSLMSNLDAHPGAAWVLQSKMKALSESGRLQVKAAVAEWKARSAMGAGRFDLFGPVPNASRSSHKKPRKKT